MNTVAIFIGDGLLAAAPHLVGRIENPWHVVAASRRVVSHYREYQDGVQLPQELEVVRLSTEEYLYVGLSSVQSH